MPMPPSCAMAMASRASVTVSMAADTSGRFRRMFRENWVEREVSLGRTWENAGTNNTSSKVSALPSRRIGMAPKTRLYPCRKDPSVLTPSPRALVRRLLRRGCKKAALPPLCAPFASEQAKKRILRRYTGEMDLKLVSRTLILAVAGGSFALTAFAQWQWIDKDGRKVFSDR